MSSFNLRLILQANKQTCPNLLDWLQNLRVVLKSKKLRYVLKDAIPPPPTTNTPNIDHKVY